MTSPLDGPLDTGGSGSGSGSGKAGSSGEPGGSSVGPLSLTMSPERERQADKIKSLLARYYDIENDGGDVGGERGEGDEGGVTDSTCVRVENAEVEEIQPDGDEEMQKDDVIYQKENESAHDGESLITQIKSNQRLDDLLTTERELATDIGNADIELRGVVYDSYCAFMQAAETVKELHLALHEVDASLHTLDALLSSVAENSQGIDDRLTEHQRIIFDMHKKRQVVEGVEALLKVDERMQEEMEVGGYEQVVRLYSGSRDALVAYQGYEAVSQVRIRVEAIREELVGMLRARMDRKAMDMLVGLGEGGVELLKAYLARRRDVLAETGTGTGGGNRTQEGGVETAGGGEAAKDADDADDAEHTQDARWGIIEETVTVSREVFASDDFKDSFDSVEESLESSGLGEFVSDAVQDIVGPIVSRVIEAEMLELGDYGGFDVTGSEHGEQGGGMEQLEYGTGLNRLFETFDRFLRRAKCIDELSNLHALPATATVKRVIFGAMERHVRAAYVVVGARAFRAIKEMMMRLLLSEGDDARFLRVLIKSLEVGVKQDFGLVEKVVEAWVSWDGCVSKMEVLDCLDGGCRDMLACLCTCCDGMMATSTGGTTTENGTAKSALFVAITATSSAISSPSSKQRQQIGFLEKQFTVPATLSRMSEAAPVASLCLASCLSKIRAAVVDADMHETAVAPAVDVLTCRYVNSMTKSLISTVSTLFERDVLGQTASPPSGPSSAAHEIVRVVTQVETDRANTNWNEGTWAIDLLCAAIEREMEVAERLRLSKSAFQQLQVDVAAIRKRVGPGVDASVLNGVVSRAAEWCYEPALVEPLVLERVVDA